jgi:hypothetical protein
MKSMRELVEAGERIRGKRRERATDGGGVEHGMFTAIAHSPQPIRLHRLQGTILASTGPYIARAQGGQLLDQRKTEVVGPPNAQGEYSSPFTTEYIRSIEGRWPDSAWTSTQVGWAFSHGTPYPREGMVRWNEGRGQWVEQPEIAWARGWADGVLAGSIDGKVRWVDGSDRPIPPALAGSLVSDFLSVARCRVSKAGDVLLEIQRSPHLAPGWWIFPCGECKPERVVLPPDMDETRVSLEFGHSPCEFVVHGGMKSGEPFCAYRDQGVWRPLPPLPTDPTWTRLMNTPSGDFVIISLDFSSMFSIYRLARQEVWEPMPIFFYANRCFPSMYDFEIGEGGELWLALEFSTSGMHDAILYHARI